jgi:hypothetical protein
MHTEGIHLPNTEETIMRVLQVKEVKAVSGAGLITSAAKGLFYVGKGLVHATGTILRILI